MQKTVYEDYKYSMLDSNCLYIGAKYTFEEILENEDILFKFRKVVADSLLKDNDKEDTLESFLYFLEPDDFRVQVLKQMRCKIRISSIKEVGIFKKRKEYVTSFISVTDLVKLSKEEKEKIGIVIQELRVNKLALLTV